MRNATSRLSACMGLTAVLLLAAYVSPVRGQDLNDQVRFRTGSHGFQGRLVPDDSPSFQSTQTPKIAFVGDVFDVNSGTKVGSLKLDVGYVRPESARQAKMRMDVPSHLVQPLGSTYIWLSVALTESSMSLVASCVPVMDGRNAIARRRTGSASAFEDCYEAQGRLDGTVAQRVLASANSNASEVADQNRQNTESLRQHVDQLDRDRRRNARIMNCPIGYICY